MTPRQLSEEQLNLSAEYQKLSDELGTLTSKKDIAWLGMRAKAKSDKEADRLWGASQDGQRETYLRYYLKGLEKRMSSIRSHLRILDVEAHNQF